MHTVELLDEGLAAARQLGYRIREEWLGGNGGGSCVLRGQKWLFLDLALDAADRLALVAQALSTDPAVGQLTLSSGLRELVGARKTA